MDLVSFNALVTQASGYNQLGPCVTDAYYYEFEILGFSCPKVPASQCISTICADSASDWLAGMSAEASSMACQSTAAASAGVVFSNLCDANGVVIAATTRNASLPLTTVNIPLATPAASLTTATAIQTGSFLSNIPFSTTPTPTASTTTPSPIPSTTSNTSSNNSRFNYTSTILGIIFGTLGALGTVAGAWYAYKMYRGWEQKRRESAGWSAEMA